MSVATGKSLYGIGAEFDSAASLHTAAEKIRDRGFKKWDVHSPFPIHGMDAAMGLGKSTLGFFVFFGGATGLTTAVLLQWFTNSFDYPLVVQGKPTDLFGTIPAFFPVIFELTILFSAFAAICTLMVMTGLPRWNHPVFEWDRFAKFSDDGFFVVIEARDGQFETEKVEDLLQSLGGKNITRIEAEL
jgi:hypothetical protein